MKKEKKLRWYNWKKLVSDEYPMIIHCSCGEQVKVGTATIKRKRVWLKGKVLVICPNCKKELSTIGDKIEL